MSVDVSFHVRSDYAVVAPIPILANLQGSPHQRSMMRQVAAEAQQTNAWAKLGLKAPGGSHVAASVVNVNWR